MKVSLAGRLRVSGAIIDHGTIIKKSKTHPTKKSNLLLKAKFSRFAFVSAKSNSNDSWNDGIYKFVIIIRVSQLTAKL